MGHLGKFALIGVAAASLSACVEKTTARVPPGTPATAQMPGGTPNAAEQACLAAVSRSTKNGDVVLLGSEFSQAGTMVRVGVGPQRAPWKCIAYRDGSTAGIEFVGSNG